MPTGEIPQISLDDLRSSLVELSEALAEGALSGQVERAILIQMAPSGDMQCLIAGVRPTDALGMLQFAQAFIMRRLMAGG